MMSITEIHDNVAQRATECPFCGYDPEAADVQTSRSDRYDEEYHGIDCPECRARYEDDQQEWYKPTAPGEETPRVQV